MDEELAAPCILISYLDLDEQAHRQFRIEGALID